MEVRVLLAAPTLSNANEWRKGWLSLLRIGVGAGGACQGRGWPLEGPQLSHIDQGVHNLARVTIEDCIDKLPNRFELVLLAAHRARNIAQGQQITVERDNDKDPVVSLREIASTNINSDDLREEFIHAMQKQVEVDEAEETDTPLISQSGDMSMVDDSAQLGQMEQMTEEELLRGLEGLPPAESPGSQRNGF